jgi:hypothetical protein
MLGFCVALISGGVRLAGFRSLSLTSLVRFGRGSWTSSCAIVSQGSLKHIALPYLKRLRIPVAHSADRGHLVEAIREVVELLHAMC